MPQFIFTGRMTLNGVEFYIEAEDLADACKKAKAGEYEHYEAAVAEISNWYIHPDSGALNE
jgi:hypothetical protein